MEVPSIFVNRETELRQINEAVETLQDEQRLLRTPIIEYSGVHGIGKTTLLHQVKAICDNKRLSCIMANAGQITPSELDHLESLASKEPVAFILDSLDAVDNEKLQTIETRLSELIDNSRLFVILASRNAQKFERTRSIARKLTIHQLKPLKQESCLEYLNNFVDTIPPETRNIIFEWTRGYPLAMQFMTNAILTELLDPAKEQDRIQLLNFLMQEVVDKNLLATVSSASEQTRLRTLLALLSIPRRFNLILLQNLVEQFAPQYKLESSLAYITLPPDINSVTSVLYWSMERAGFCIDAPVRNLFLLQYRIEQPQQFDEIHKFLAEKNRSFAQQVTGSDRIRYLREFFYHLAFSEEESKVREILAQQIEQLARVQTQGISSLENFLQFFEEFAQDEELKEVLGPRNASFALALVYRNFIEIYRQIPEKTTREAWLKRFFSRFVQQPRSDDFVLIFEQGMRQITQQVARVDAIKLYNELIQDTDLKELLGERLESVRSRIGKDLQD